MPRDPRHHVLPGQPLRLAAEQVNALNRMMRVSGGMTAGPQAAAELAPNVVLIRNGSGLDVPLLGVLGISGVEITPQKDSQFPWKQLLVGAVPVLASHRDRFVVCLEPIAAGAIGRAAIGGMFACKVHVTSTLHRFATVKDGDRTQLQSAACGPMQLVWTNSWIDGGIGLNKWAIGVM